MKVYYKRTSTISQSTARQIVDENIYDYIVEDKVSGSTPFAEREGGKRIIKLLEKGEITQLGVWQTDRLGRDVRDIINTIHLFTIAGVCIHFISDGLRTLNPDGSENPISKMVINILGVISEMEKNQIRERQLQGIEIAKAKGVYKGRKMGTKEDVLTFLSKPKNKKITELLKKGYRSTEIQKITGASPNTINKIRKCRIQL
jgi:DNA invertase Pin-like site-specific DNA recombinase